MHASAKKIGERGMAMVTVLILVVGMAGLAAAVLIRLNLESKSAQEYVRQNSALIAAEAGLEYAAAQLWSNYLGGLGSSLPVLAGVRTYLDKLVPINGVTNLLLKPIPFVNGANIDQILVSRTDTGSQTVLKVKSQGSFQGRTRTVVQLFTLSGSSFNGFDYALLANNIDCIMCHAEFDNVERYYNTDSSKWGTFDRVKVASLESLLVRLNDTQSRMAGSLYTRGELLGTKGSGNNGITGGIFGISSLSGSSFLGYGIDTSGKIKQDNYGNLISDDLETVVPGSDGLLPKYGQVYANYPTDPALQTDGALPTNFPALIEDTNANRIVDDDEWKNALANGTFGAAQDGTKGVIGGIVYGVPIAAVLDTRGLPSKSNSASENARAGYYDGNLVLVGTAKEPLIFSGTLAVNGDVIISGPVKGTGKIIARNNLYITGDVNYADGEKFGVASDGTQNMMSYGAGGNIVIGDFLTPENYNKDKYGKYKVVLYDDSNKKYPSYLSSETMDLAFGLDNGESTSYASSQMMLSNKMEYEKAQKLADYTPRYYSMGPDMKIFRQLSDATVTDYESWAAREITAKEYGASPVSTLLPKTKWISPNQFKQIWWDDEQRRSLDVEERFRVDGLLYTNNMIIGGAHSNNRHYSRLNGTLEVRGAIVAADVGILAPGDSRPRKNAQGFRLYYDKRVKNGLALGGSKDLALVRGVKLVEVPGSPL